MADGTTIHNDPDLENITALEAKASELEELMDGFDQGSDVSTLVEEWGRVQLEIADICEEIGRLDRAIEVVQDLSSSPNLVRARLDNYIHLFVQSRLRAARLFTHQSKYAEADSELEQGLATFTRIFNASAPSSSSSSNSQLADEKANLLLYRSELLRRRALSSAASLPQILKKHNISSSSSAAVGSSPSSSADAPELTPSDRESMMRKAGALALEAIDLVQSLGPLHSNLFRAHEGLAALRLPALEQITMTEKFFKFFNNVVDFVSKNSTAASAFFGTSNVEQIRISLEGKLADNMLTQSEYFAKSCGMPRRAADKLEQFLVDLSKHTDFQETLIAYWGGKHQLAQKICSASEQLCSIYFASGIKTRAAAAARMGFDLCCKLVTEKHPYTQKCALRAACAEFRAIGRSALIQKAKTAAAAFNKATPQSKYSIDLAVCSFLASSSCVRLSDAELEDFLINSLNDACVSSMSS